MGPVFRGLPRPYHKGAGSQRSPIFGVPSIYAYTLCRRTTKFDVVRRGGRACILVVSHASHPKRAEFQRSPFWGSLIYAHLLTQNDQILYLGRVVFFGGQPRHCFCTSASRGLSATAQFLVQFLVRRLSYTQLGQLVGELHVAFSNVLHVKRQTEISTVNQNCVHWLHHKEGH